jgi:AGZA family xanthine/uracil permease-like MFS transporter
LRGPKRTRRPREQVRLLSGGIYLPWSLDDASRPLVWQFSGASLVLAVVLTLLSVASLQKGAGAA